MNKLETENNDTTWAVHRDDSLLEIIKKTVEDPDWQPSYYIHHRMKERKNSRTKITMSWISVKGFHLALFVAVIPHLYKHITCTVVDVDDAITTVP